MTTKTERVPAALSRVAGIELDAYREKHVAERIRRALERERVESVEGLVRLLRERPDARVRFRRSVAVSVSGLFRDPAQFDLLEREVLPQLLATDRRLRVWSAGCADGSELYSIGLLLERQGALERSILLGSDLLEENLALATAGVYGDVQLPRDLCARTRWERRDLVRDGAPPGRWGLVLCRNVAIYLANDAKQRLHATLADSLARDGVLLLGRSERLADRKSMGLEQIGPHTYRRST